jgi:amino acid transporter
MSVTLARRLGFFSLIVYGIGDILGAGIYALVGKVIGISGTAAWVTFILTAMVAVITGLSYAELTGRYPVAAGAAAFVRRAFPGKLAATVTGMMVLGTGLASAATVTVAFSGYLQEILTVPAPVAQVMLLGGISFLSFWGIHESSRVNLFLTLVEAVGLAAVIAVGAWLADEAALQNFWRSTRSDFNFLTALSGITLAFYAYIGFEDLANLAEECKNPSRDLPRAILIAIAVTTVIYILVTLALSINVPLDAIAASETPLLLVFEKAGLHGVFKIFSLVAILAITNTGLINLIMASRLMYGMSREELLPEVLGKVHPRRYTPWVSILVAFGLVLLLVFTGGLKVLAQTTSLLIVVVFLLVHVSLIRVKLKKEAYSGMRFPMMFPCLGVVLSATILTQFPLAVWLRSLTVVGIGFFLWVLQLGKKKNPSE